MGSLIKQECFKLSKKKSTWIWPIVIIAIMITLLFISQNSDIMFSEGLIQGGFSGFYWVVILMTKQVRLFQWNFIMKQLKCIVP